MPELWIHATPSPVGPVAHREIGDIIDLAGIKPTDNTAVRFYSSPGLLQREAGYAWRQIRHQLDQFHLID
ncbi:hypothetical protein GF345_04355 [Candidatus Woesearchaeota archaeon]|nr:hypothetical protein [Candidatus Woesearchaeota archaeon]